MAGYSQSIHNAVHDACLTVFGYLPSLIQFEIFNVAKQKGETERLVNLYEVPKTFQLPQDLTWGNFFPEGNPSTNIRVWEQEAINFLRNPEDYLIALSDIVPIASANWSNVNIVNNAGQIMSDLQKDFVSTLDLCVAYDKVWPRIAANYKSMTLIDPTPTQGLFEKFNAAIAGGKEIPYPQPHLHSVPDNRPDSMI